MELRTKKLMTVAKSKYYMLKVNFPKLAELVDNEALYDDTEDQQEEERQSQFTNNVRKVNDRLK